MVNVEGFGIGVKLDKDVINCIKFLKVRQLLGGPIFERDADGGYVLDHWKMRAAWRGKKQMTINAKWVGYSNKKKRTINLDTKWVEANFNNKFLDQLKNFFENNWWHSLLYHQGMKGIMNGGPLNPLLLVQKCNIYRRRVKEHAWCIQWPTLFIILVQSSWHQR
jgi:hypothetical protein